MFKRYNISTFLNHDLLIGGLLAILIVIAKVPFLNLPLFWDEQSYVHGAWIISQNNLNPFIEFHSYKPPFIFLVVAFIYKVFGYSVITFRLVVTFLSFFALYFTFLLGRELYNREVGLWAALLLFFSPLFYAHSGLSHCAIPLAALTLSTVYFFIKNEKIKYFISATLLVLTKETAILVLIAIASYECLTNLLRNHVFSHNILFIHKMKKLSFRILFLLSPLSFFCFWMILNRLFLGWFLWPRNLSFFHKASFSLYTLEDILSNLFWVHFRYVISIAILVGFFFSIVNTKIRNKLLRKEIILFLILAFITVIFFLWMGSGSGYAPLPRYFIFVHPLFFVFGTVAIIQLLRNKLAYRIAFIVTIILFILCWYTADFSWTGELNLNHRHIIKVYKDSSEFLEKNSISSTIFSIWPMINNLTNPNLGYVKQPLEDVIDINGIFDFKGLERIIYLKKSAKTDDIIFVIPTISVLSSERQKWIDFLLQKKELSLLRSFESSKAKVFIYSL